MKSLGTIEVVSKLWHDEIDAICIDAINFIILKYRRIIVRNLGARPLPDILLLISLVPSMEGRMNWYRAAFGQYLSLPFGLHWIYYNEHTHATHLQPFL